MTDVKTSLQSNPCQDNGPAQVKRTRGPISEANIFSARHRGHNGVGPTEIRSSTSCGLQLVNQNWNLRSRSDSYMCVHALRSLSGSKPFLMIEWGTALEHTWRSADDHIWASSLGLLPFNNYHARLLEWIEG